MPETVFLSAVFPAYFTCIVWLRSILELADLRLPHLPGNEGLVSLHSLLQSLDSLLSLFQSLT